MIRSRVAAGIPCLTDPQKKLSPSLPFTKEDRRWFSSSSSFVSDSIIENTNPASGHRIIVTNVLPAEV
jgi:hypothetical protein